MIVLLFPSVFALRVLTLVIHFLSHFLVPLIYIRSIDVISSSCEI